MAVRIHEKQGDFTVEVTTVGFAVRCLRGKSKIASMANFQSHLCIPEIFSRH